MKTHRILLLGLALCASLLAPPAAQSQVYTKLDGLVDHPNTREGITYRVQTRQVSADYTLKLKDDHTILADATAGAITIALPAAGTNTTTRVFYVQKTDSSGNAVTLDGSGSETIDGQSTYVLSAQYQGVLLQAGFGSWHVVGAGASATSTTNSTTWTQTSNNAAALASGPNGNTNPVFRLVNNVTSAATGISVTGRAVGAGVDITVLSSGTDEGLNVEAKGAGSILLNGTATGAVFVGDRTNPAFSVVHTTEGTGFKVTSAAAGAGVALTATSSGTDENGTIDAKGSGTLTFNGTATGGIVLARATSASSTLAVTGAITPTGGVAAAGGFSASPRGLHTGQHAAYVSTDGNDSTPSITETYVSEIFVPANCTITGIALFNGSDVTGNVTVGLADSTGAPIAAAKSASTAGSGTDAYQLVPFATPYAAKGPATYYIQVQYSSATARYNTHTLGTHGVLVQTGQSYGTLTSFTPPTTFVTNVGNICGLY